MSVFGFRDQHASEKGTERQRQAGGLTQPGQPQRHEQHIEHEQLGRFAAGDKVEPAAHQALAEEEHDGQEHHRLNPGQAEHEGQLLRRLGKGRDEHQERHHREILEKQHTDHLAPVRRIEFQTLAKQFDEHGRRGHGQRPAQSHARLPRQAKEKGNTERRANGGQHLQEAQAEDDALHGKEPRQRELQSDREHQKDDAELGQMAHPAGIIDEMQNVRPEQDANQQIAEHRGHAGTAQQNHGQYRCGKKNENSR